MGFTLSGALTLVSCNRDGNKGITDGSLGTKIEIVSGNSQLALPAVIYNEALTVKVSDSVEGKPIPNVKVYFKNLTASSNGGQVLGDFVLTDDSGLASIRAKAPSNFNQSFRVEASVEGTRTVKTIFDLGTETVGECVLFTGRTSVNPDPDATVEVPVTAGVKFGFIIECIDNLGNISTDVSGVRPMTFIFDSKPSWAYYLNTGNGAVDAEHMDNIQTKWTPRYFENGGAVASPLTGITYSFDCNFVNGVCTTLDMFLVTDARVGVDNTTRFWISDSTGTILGPAAQPISVESGPEHEIAMALGSGGPTAGALARHYQRYNLSSDSKFDVGFSSERNLILIDSAGNWKRDLLDNEVRYQVTETSRDSDAPVGSFIGAETRGTTSYSVLANTVAPFSEAKFEFRSFRSGQGTLALTQIDPLTSATVRSATRTMQVYPGRAHHLRARFSTSGFGSNLADYTAAPLDETDPLYTKYVANVLYDATTQSLVDPEDIRQKVVAGETYGLYITARDRSGNLVQAQGNFPAFTGGFNATLGWNLRWYHPGFGELSTPPFDQPQRHPVPSCNFAQIGEWSMGAAMMCDNGSPTSHAMTFQDARLIGDAQANGGKYPTVRIAPLTAPHPLDATDLNNKFTINVQTAASGVLPALSGSTRPVRVLRGPPTWMMIFDQDPTVAHSIVCRSVADQVGLVNQNTPACINDAKTSDPQRQFWTRVTDRGGNIIPTTPATVSATWTGFGHLAGDVFPTDAAGVDIGGAFRPSTVSSIYGAYTAIAAGDSALQLRNSVSFSYTPEGSAVPVNIPVNAIEAAFRIRTQVRGLDQFEISVDDDRNLPNNIMATKIANIRVKMLDSTGQNTIQQTGQVDLKIQILGATNGRRPDGTSVPWAPCNVAGCSSITTVASGTYAGYSEVTVPGVYFLNGLATVTGLVLPNSSASGNIRVRVALVTDETIASDKTKPLVSPVVVPGPTNEIRIRTITSGAGNLTNDIQDLTTTSPALTPPGGYTYAPQTISTDGNYTYTAATYDRYGNWKQDVSASWDAGSATMTTGSIGAPNSGVPSNGLHLDAAWNSITTASGVVATHPSCPGAVSHYSAGGPLSPVTSVSLQVSPFRALAAQPVRVLRASYSPPASDIDSAYSAGTVFSVSGKFVIQPGNISRVVADWIDNANLSRVNQPMRAGDRFNLRVRLQDSECNKTQDTGVVPLLISKSGMASIRAGYNANYSNYDSGNPLSNGQTTGSTPVQTFFENGESVGFIQGVPTGDNVADKATAQANPIWFKLNAAGLGQRFVVQIDQTPLSGTTGFSPNFITINNTSYDHYAFWPSSSPVVAGGSVQFNVEPRDKFGNTLTETYDVPSGTFSQAMTATNLYFPSQGNAGDGTSCRAAGYYGANTGACGSEILTNVNFAGGTWSVASDKQTASGQIDSSLNSGVGLFTATFRQSANNPGRDLRVSTPTAVAGGSLFTATHIVTPVRVLPLPVSDPSHDVSNPIKLSWNVRPGLLNGGTGFYEHTVSRTATMNAPGGFSARIFDRYDNWVWTDNSTTGQVSMVVPGPNPDNVDPAIFQDSRDNSASPLTSDSTVNGTITWTYARYPRAHAAPVTLSASVGAGGGATISSNVKFNAGIAAQVLALMTGPTNATPWSQTAQGSEQGFQGGVNCLVANPPSCTVGALTGTPVTKRAGQPFRVTLLLVDDAYNIVPAAGGSFRLQLVTNGSGIPDDPNATITVDRTSAGGSATTAYTPNTDVSLNGLDGGVVSFMVTPKKAGSFSGAWPVPTVGSTYQVAPSAGFLPGVASTAYTVQPAVPSALPGSPLKLTALLQGQTLTSGQASTSSTPTQAVSGTPASQSVGDDFEVRVYATDAYFNPVGPEASVVGSTVTLQSNDLSPTSPNATFDSNGIAIFSTSNANAFNFKRAMPYNSAVVASAIPSAKFTLSATSISNAIVPNSSSNRFDSSNFTTTPDAATQTVIRLAEQFLVPGASSAGAAITNGSAPGCAGASFCRTAGVASRVDVLAVDANFNIDPSFRSGGTANLSTPADTPSGVGEPTVYRTPTTTFAGGIAAFLNAAPILGNGGTGASPDTSGRVQYFAGTEALTNNNSTNVTVRPNTPTNVLVRLNSAGILSQVFTPGQSSSTTALTGTPSTADPNLALSYAGNPFLFDVILADAYFNQVPDSTTTTQISSPGDTIASFDFNGDDVFGDSTSQTFTNGRISNVKVKNFLAGASRVIRANSGSGSLDYQTPPYIINNGPAFKIVTPGQPQLNDPGTVVAGTAFSYPYAIFDEWNNALTYGPDTTSTVAISLSTAPSGGAICNATDATYNSDPSNIAYYLCTPYSPASVTSTAATGLPLTSGTFSAASGLNIRRAAASAYRLRLTKASTTGTATQNRPAGTGSLVATSDLFSASNAPATTLTLTNINLNTNVAAGTPDTVTVTAYDKYSNVAQDYPGPVSFSTTQDTLDEYAEISGRVLPPSSAMSGGTLTIANVLLLTAATDVSASTPLSVSVTGARPGGGANTGSCPAGTPASGTLCATVSGIQRKAGTLHHLNVRTDATATNYTNTPKVAGLANPSDPNSPRNKVLTRTAGEPLDVLVVQAEDIYNNRVVDFTGTLNFRAWNVGTNSLDTNSGNFVTTLPSSSLSFTLGEQGRKVLLGSATGGSVGTSVIFRKTDTNSTSSVRQVQAQAVGFLGNAYTSSPNITVNAAPAWRIAAESQIGKPQASEIVVNNLASNSHPAVRVYDYYDNPVATATVRYSVLGGALADNATVNGSVSQVDLPVSAVAGAGLGVATLNSPGWKVGRYIGSLSSGAGGVNPFPTPVSAAFNPYKIRATLLSPATPSDPDGSIEAALAARGATRVSSIDWDTLPARSDIGNQIAFVDFPSSSPQITAGTDFSTGFGGANSVRVGVFDQHGNPIDLRTRALGDESAQISLRAYPSALDCSASTNEIAIVTNPAPVFGAAPSPHASNFVNGVKTVSASSLTVADGAMTTYRAVFDNTAIVTAADTMWIQARVTSGPAGLSGKIACAPNAIAVKPAAPSKLTFNSVSLSATTGQNLAASSPVVAIRDVYGNIVKTPNYSVTQDIQLRARTDSCTGTIRSKAGDGSTDALTKGDGSALAALTAPTSGAVVNYSSSGGLRMNYTDPSNYSNVYLEAYSTDAGVTVACAGPITVSPTPYRLAFTQMPDTLWHADAALQTQPVVRVFDQYGNLANLTGTVQLQATTDTSCLVPAGNTPSGATALVAGANKDQIALAAANVATFSGTQLRLKSSTLHLKASVSGQPAILTDCTGSPYVAAGYPVSATTTVITAGAPVLANSSVSATDRVVVSTGASLSTATLTLRDQFQNLVQTGIAPLSVAAPSFSISGTSNSTTCAASAHTNASGVLACTLSSTKAETKTFTVTVPSIASSTTTNARFIAADADRVRIMNGVAGSGVSAFTTTLNAGASFAPVVVAEIQDEFGNPVETSSSTDPSPDNARGLVLEAFSDADCTTNTNQLYTASTLGVSQSAVATSSRATFAATVNHRATGTIYLQVRKSAPAWTSPRTILSDCFSATPITINPLGPHHLTTTFAVTSTDLSGNTSNYYLTASPGTSGASPSASIQISLKDVYGNPTDGGGLTPAVTVSGSGTQTMVCGVANSVTGVSNCTFTARTVGTRNFTITGFTPSTPGSWTSNVVANNQIRVVPDAAAKLAYTAEPNGVGRAGVALSTQPSVEIRDTYDNTILSSATASSYGLTPDAKLGSSVTLSAWTGSCGSSQGTGFLNSAGDSQTASSAASPSVTFSGLTYTKTSQAVYFQAAATGLTAACSSSPLTITQSSATPGDIVLGNVPASVIAGTPFSTPNMTVTLRDVYQNVKTDYVSTVTMSTNDADATAAGWYSTPLSYILSDNGVKTFAVRLKTTTGPWTVSAAAAGYSSATSAGISVTPATIGSFVVGAVSPSSPKAGDLLTVSVTAKDTQGNTKTDYSGTVNLASIAGGSESLGSCTGFASGVASCSFTLTTSGTRNVSFTDSVVGTATGSTGTFALVPNVPHFSKSLVSVGASCASTSSTVSIASASATRICVQPRDQYDNIITLNTGIYASTLSFTHSGGVSTLVQDDGSTPLPVAASWDAVNLRWFAQVRGLMAGAATSIVTTLDASTVTTAAPTVTVTSGPFDLGQSAIAVASSSVASGSGVTVTLTPKDAAGNLNPTGVTTVVFTKSGGTSTGSFSAQAGSGGGNHTITYTGILVGTPQTLGATINSSPITATTTVSVTPGVFNVGQSTLAVSPSSVASGSDTTIVLTPKDAAGNSDPTGITTVEIIKVSGTASVTQGASFAASPSASTYTATMTGQTAGTAVYKARINSVSDVTQQPTLTVTPGPFSLGQSQLTLASGSVASGSAVVATLVPRDAAGNASPTGVTTVSFAHATGTSTGSFSGQSGSGGGTYTTNFTGETAGTPTTITASINGSAVTGTQNITVTSGGFSLTQSALTLSAGTVASGSAIIATLVPKDAAGNINPTGVTTVSFSRAGGVSTGSFAGQSGTGGGTYTTNFTGALAGSATTITATINGSPVVGTQNVTVTPGPFNVGTSTLAFSPTSVASGSTTVLTLTPKDAAGNSDPTGITSVDFVKVSGVATIAEGSSVSAAASGSTYVATLTGAVGGTAVFKAQINAASDVTQQPTLTVSAGPVSVAQSTLTLSASSVASGSAIVATLVPKDASGNINPTGVTSVSFSHATGTSTGSFSGQSGSGGGTYTSNFTGTLAGSPTTITASINSSPVTDTENVTVTAGGFSVAQSTLTLSSSTVASGSVIVATLVPKDASGNINPTGVTSVSFAHAGGVSTGSFSNQAGSGGGTYTSDFTGTLAGAATTITASINSTPVTGTQNVTVTPGPFNVGTSTLAFSPTSVASASTTVLTLTPKDAAGNTSPSGITSVDFIKVSGVATIAEGSSVSASASGNTYVATLTGAVGGTAVFKAQINAASDVTQQPTLTVSAGPVSVAQSTLSLSASTVASGSAIVATLVPKDASGNINPTGVTSVSFSHAGGVSTGSFSGQSGSGGGTYTSNFTGSLAGSATTITALINASPVADTDTVSVTPGPVSQAQSALTLASSTVVSGSSIVATLVPKDAAGNINPTGVTSVSFAHAGGVSTGSFSNQAGSGGGTYTSDFTGTLAGAATTITASINSTPVTGTQNITVTPGAFSLSSSTFTLSSSTVASGASITGTLTPKDAAGNTNPTGVTSVDFAHAGGTSTGSFSGQTGSGGGVYTTSFTGTLKGTPTTITASINSSPVTTTRDVTVGAGVFSVAQSTISLSASSVASASTVTVTLTPKDAAGNTNPTGVTTVVFTKTGGTSTGNFSSQSGSGGGDHTIVYTGVIAGAAQTIGATINGSAVADTEELTVTAGALDHFAVTQLDGNPRVAGAVTQIEVSAADAAGNLVSTWTGALGFTCSETGFSTTCPSGSISSGGTATFNATLNVATTQSISVSAAGKSGSLTGIVVNPAAATSVTVASGGGQSATVGTTVASAIVFEVKDTHGNVVKGGTSPNASLSLTISTAHGSVSPTSISVNSSGAATLPAASWTLPTTPLGSKTLTAQIPSQGSVNVTATATADAAVLVTEWADNVYPTAFKNAPVGSVTARTVDTHGNPVSGVAVTFEGYATNNCSGGHSTLASGSTNGSGQVDLTGAQFATSGTKSVRAESSGITSGTCFAVTVYEDPNVSVSSGTVSGGGTVTVTVSGGNSPSAASVSSGGIYGSISGATFTADTGATDCGTAVVTSSETLNGVTRSDSENIIVTQAPVLSHDLAADHDYLTTDSNSDIVVEIDNATCGPSGALVASVTNGARFEVLNTVTCDSGINQGTCTVTVRYKGAAGVGGPHTSVLSFTAGGSSNGGLPSKNLTGESSP
jgi:adhesin/invasin